MNKRVSIARALKEKSRVAGRIHTLTDIINHENSLAEGSTRSVDPKQLLCEVKALTEKLIKVKTAIALGNQAAIPDIVELGEAKAMIGFLGRLNTSEYYTDDYSRHVKLEAAIRKSDVMVEIDGYQRRVNALQDSLDDFNASHFVDIEIDD